MPERTDTPDAQAAQLAHQVAAGEVFDLATAAARLGGESGGHRELLAFYGTLLTCVLCQVRLVLGADVTQAMAAECTKVALTLDMQSRPGVH